MYKLVKILFIVLAGPGPGLLASYAWSVLTGLGQSLPMYK